MSAWRRWWRDQFFIVGDSLCARRSTFGAGNWLSEVGWRIGSDKTGRPLR